MKKYTRLLSAPLMLAFALFLCMGISTPLAQATESDFEIVDGTLIKYNGPGGDVVIPHGVTAIGGIAFWGCTSVKHVVIPSSVTEIGSGAFYCCTNLRNIVIPSSVTSIGNDAFKDCTSLTSITIPDSVTSIGHFAFSGCHALTKIVISDSVVDVDYSAFEDTPWETNQGDFLIVGKILLKYRGSDEKVVIPDCVTDIGWYAFGGCTSLTDVVIPSSVTNIGKSAFSNCTSLTGIVIPNSVTGIGESAFSNCTSLTGIVIPDSVTSIGDDAFSDCTGLTSIEIPDSVTKIGGRAFNNCTSLISAIIPASVTEMGGWTFHGCTNLKYITAPTGASFVLFGYDEEEEDLKSVESITILGRTARLSDLRVNCGYVNLKNVFVPNVVEIADDAFRGCTNPEFAVYGAQDADYYAYVAGHKAVTAYADARGRHNYVSPQSGVIVSKSNEICAGLTTDYEKVRAVYTWMAENIVYDYDYYWKRKSTVITDPEGVLNCKLTVCDGYARLTRALLQAQGIPTMYITGPALGELGWELHAWNAAYSKEQGRWMYLDSTWGKVQQRDENGNVVELPVAKYDYFDISPYVFATDHHADPMPSETFTVSPNRSTVLVNGKKVEFESYEIGGNNYFKLRDLAAALSGTEKQFDVTWDNEKQAVNLVTEHPYTFVAGELVPGDGQAKQAKVNAPETYLNGQRLFLPAYEIHGNNYVKLRDIADIVDFGVLWDNASKTVVIDSTTGYSV